MQFDIRKFITVCAFHFPFPTKSEIKTKESSTIVNIEKVILFQLQVPTTFKFGANLTFE